MTDMMFIMGRSKEVESLTRPREGDLIKGKRNRSAIGTIMERKSQFLSLVRIKSLDEPSVCAAFGKQMNLLPKEVRMTLTYDRGKELAEHKVLVKIAKITVYLADPHSPWQRATCENTNGLFKLYFPKRGIGQSQGTKIRESSNATEYKTTKRSWLEDSFGSHSAVR